MPKKSPPTCESTDVPAKSLISNHFRIVGEELEASSKRLTTASHGGIRGLGREILAKVFLSSHLPNSIDFFTGEIIDHNNKKSSQIDLIIYGGHSPKLPLFNDNILAFNDAVLAAIEVKSFLNLAELKTSLAACERLKSMVRDEHILGRNDSIPRNPMADLLRRHNIKVESDPESRSTNLKSTPYIVFAYSGMKLNTLLRHMESYEKSNSNSEYTLDTSGPDMIINLEKGYYIYKNNDFLWPKSRAGDNVYGSWVTSATDYKGEALAGLYILLSNLATAFLLRPPLVQLPDFFKEPE